MDDCARVFVPFPNIAPVFLLSVYRPYAANIFARGRCNEVLCVWRDRLERRRRVDMYEVISKESPAQLYNHRRDTSD